MLNHSNISYTLDNYDTISTSSLNGINSAPFVLIGYPESNIVVVHTKNNDELYPCSFFCESEIGFGKESAMVKKENSDIGIAVIAQNELDSSTIYYYECKKNNEYNWNNLKKKQLSNRKQTITNSLSMCSNNNNILICVFGYDMLSDKGNVLLHYCDSNENKWENIDLTELCGDYMQVGTSSQLVYHNDKYYLFYGDKFTNKVKILSSKNILNWNLEKEINCDNFNNLSVEINKKDIWLSICTQNKNNLYKNLEFNFTIELNEELFVKSKLLNNDGTLNLFAEISNNKISIFTCEKDWDNTPKQTIVEDYDFNMNVFVDYYGNNNLFTIKKSLRSDFLLVKKLNTDNLENKSENNDKSLVNVFYYGNNENTSNNTKERSQIIKYLFDEYFDTLDSNTFSSYRCFFLKTFLNKQDALFDTKNNNAKIYSTKQNKSNCSFKNLEEKYDNIHINSKSSNHDKCILGYVSKEKYNDAPKSYDNIDDENKIVCFRYNSENYFPFGKLENIDKANLQMIDLILESKVISITSLNYASIRDISIKDLVKVHLFTHENDEEDETKFIIWKTLDGKKLEYPLFGVKDLFYNGLEYDIKVKLQVTSILEDFYFTIGSKCINGDVAGNGMNELILYQMKTEWDENLFDTVNLGFSMNCNAI